MKLKYMNSIRSIHGFSFPLAMAIGVLASNCLFGESPQTLNWPQWRGPSANGQAAVDAKPPIKWDKTSNIHWVAELPGEGSSTPIVWENQIFVLAAEATDRKAEKPPVADQSSKTAPPDVYYRFIVTSIERETGKVLWQKTATEQVPHEGKHQTHTYAASSPTTDGERLYVSFGSRGIFAYSLAGDLLWQVDLGDMKTRFGWGEAVTPVLAGDKLIINWDQEEGSFITALDKSSGKAVWRVERPKEATSWNTPLILESEGKLLAIVNGSDRVRAYDTQNGQEVWSCGGQTVNAIPSPIGYQDRVIVVSGYRGAAGFSILVKSHGDLTGSASITWKIDQGTPYVPSPGLSGTRLFLTTANADVLNVFDADTGKSLSSRKRLSGVGSHYSSPIVAGGHLYFAGRSGVTAVVRDDESLEIVATNDLEEPIDASPVAVGDQLLLRTWNKLYSIKSAP